MNRNLSKTQQKFLSYPTILTGTVNNSEDKIKCECYYGRLCATIHALALWSTIKDWLPTMLKWLAVLELTLFEIK